MPTIPPSNTPPPADLPLRGDRTTFSPRVDAFVTWFSTVWDEVAALATNCYNNAVEAYNNAVAALASANAAAASAATAAATASAAMWISGHAYAQGESAISPVDFATYRRKFAGSGVVDPKLDTDNWEPVIKVIGSNKLINGKRVFARRATSATVVAGTAVPTASAGYPTLDRWFAYCTGANVTDEQIAGSGATPFRRRFTGAAGVTAIGEGQRIAAKDAFDLNGKVITIGYETSNSLLGTVNWALYKSSVTADTFGTIGSPTKTLIASGTWNVTNALAKYSAQVTLGSTDASLGLELICSVGAQTSGTWVCGDAVLVEGYSSETDTRLDEFEDLLCASYLPYFQSGGGGLCAEGNMNTPSELRFGWRYPARARVQPTGFVCLNAAHFNVRWTGNLGGTLGAGALHATQIGIDACELFAEVVGAVTGGASLYTNQSGALFYLTGCEIP